MHSMVKATKQAVDVSQRHGWVIRNAGPFCSAHCAAAVPEHLPAWQVVHVTMDAKTLLQQ